MHRSSEINNVIALRKQNKSYSEIKKLTKISKSTLSDWLSKEDWSVKIKKELSERQVLANRLNIIRANEVRAKQMMIREARYIKDAHEEYLQLKNNALFIYGLGIY